MNLEEELAAIELPQEFDELPVFVVGGWVRDSVRDDAEPSDVDLMVAEVTPAEMRERGFRLIDSANNDTFAVFQDSLGREVAIAREEVSTGTGHTDFSVEPVPSDVEATEALHRDLKRRDFTCNSMAIDVRWGVLHDPHGGLQAIEEGTIRHVSEAFRDDPLRVVRGARFAARLGAEIADETKVLMEDVAPRLEELPGERLRMEMEKAFVQADSPRVFFDVLEDVFALEHSFPELLALKHVPAGPDEHHREGSTFEHTMMVLEEMKALRPNDATAMLMALVHDIGKQEELRGHGKAALPIIDEMNRRLAFSNEQLRAMKEGARHHMRLKNVNDMNEKTLFDTRQRIRNSDRLVDLMVADAKGRIPEGSFDSNALRDAFERAEQACENVTGQDLIEQGRDPDSLGGEKFGKLLRDARISEMKSLK